MAIPAYVGTELQIGVNTFGDWVNKTNQIVGDMGSNVISIGDNNTGNTSINGFFTANTITVPTAIRGGTRGASGTLNITSNTAISGRTTFNDNITLNGNFNFTITTGQIVGGTLTISSSTSFNNSVGFNNPVTVSDTIAINGAELNVSGGTTSTFTGPVVFAANVTFQDVQDFTFEDINAVTITTSGNVTVGGNLAVAGTTDLDDVLTSNADITTTGTVTAIDFNSTSDVSLKQNVEPLYTDESMEKLMRLNPVEFEWKENEETAYGLIAQEVENIFPALVKQNKNGIKTIAYQQLISHLIKAVQYQQEEITLLKQNV